MRDVDACTQAQAMERGLCEQCLYSDACPIKSDSDVTFDRRDRVVECPRFDYR